jgi:hypothetical protein
VGQAHHRFDAELRLTDDPTRKVLRSLLERFSRWIERERAAVQAERDLMARAPA